MKYLTEQDLAKLFQAMHAKNPRHHMAALVCFFTGARISQALGIKGEDIFERDGKYVILIRAKKSGLDTTHELHVDDNPAFDMRPLVTLAQSKGLSLVFGGLTYRYFNRCFKGYAEAAGIHSMYAHSHVFRHSAAMVIMNATQRVGAVQKFLGHRAASSSMIYLQENDGSLAQDAMNNLKLEAARPRLQVVA